MNEGIKHDKAKRNALIPKEVVDYLYEGKSPLHGMIMDAICIHIGIRNYEHWRLEAVAMTEEVMLHGAKKYGADNWQSLKDFNNRYFAASVRHLTAAHQEERSQRSTTCLSLKDKDSGLYHVKHFVCNCMFRMWKELQPVEKSSQSTEANREQWLTQEKVRSVERLFSDKIPLTVAWLAEDSVLVTVFLEDGEKKYFTVNILPELRSVQEIAGSIEEVLVQLGLLPDNPQEGEES